MCVAIYKPAGVSCPPEEILESCWSRNPDGAGYAYRTADGRIAIRKGFMTFDAFLKDFRRTIEASPYSGDLFVHFRIGTAGGNTPGNTHPFQITGTVDGLHATRCVCDSIVMHNGVFTVNPRDKTISDTGEFVLRLFELGIATDLKTLAAYTDAVMEGNRLAFMDAGGAYLAGEWEKLDGVWYSNMLWRRQTNWSQTWRKALGKAWEKGGDGGFKSSWRPKEKESCGFNPDRRSYKSLSSGGRLAVACGECPECGGSLYSMCSSVSCRDCGFEVSYKTYDKCVEDYEKSISIEQEDL